VSIKIRVTWYRLAFELQVEETRDKVTGRMTWNECVKVDMNKLGLVKEDAQNRNRSRSLTTEIPSTQPQCGIGG